MICISLVFAGIFLGAVLSIRTHIYERNSQWWNIITIPFLSALGALLGVFATALIGLVLTMTSIPESGSRTYVLAALGNDSQTSGTFFLGSGTVGEKLVFNYIAVQEDGGYTLESVRAEDVRVYEDATPETATFIDHTRWIDAWWFAGEGVRVSVPDSYDDEFHIPEGSIDNSYRVSVTD